MKRLLACCVTCLVVALMTSASAQSSVVSITVDDTFPGLVAAGGVGVFSDAGTTGTNHYSDYRIDPYPYLNWCVDAQPSPPGNLFVRLNRKLDGEAGTLRCSENPRPDGLAGVPRNYVARIAVDAVCDMLADPRAGLPLSDAAGAAWDTSASSTPCVLPRSDNPRIRLPTLYKAKARTTPVDFLTSMFNYPNSYEIQSDGEASISQNPMVPGLKTVSYSGTFRLVKFEPGVRARAVGPSFAMPVRMEFLQ